RPTARSRAARKPQVEALESRNLLSFAPPTAATTIPVGAGPVSVAVGDFNNDGFDDFVTANVRTNTLSVVTGKGDGTFNAPVTITLGANQRPVAVALGNFDAGQPGDKGLDLVVVTTSAGGMTPADNTVQVWLNMMASQGATPMFILSGSKQLA